MKIVVDGYWWNTGPPSGKSVTRGIVSSWSETYPDDSLLVLVPDIDAAHRENHRRNITFVKSRLGRHPLINALEIPWIVRRTSNVDAVFTHNFASPGVNSMVFVHDTIYIREPQWFTVWEKAYLSLIRLSLHRGVKVLTSSRSEALHIERDLQLAHPVIPVGLGLNPELIYGESNRPELARGLDGFVLAVGRLNIRKNLERTIAGALETGLFSAEFPIIVVGSADGRLDENAEFVKKAISGGVVRFAGFLENSELRWLYQHCRLMTYLSLAEGFGLPPLEAISLGAEVLASDLPVFREVLGEGATYVDPLSENEIAKAITAILSKSSRSLPSAGGEFNVLDSGPNWEAVVRKVRAEVGCTARMGNAE